GTHTALQVASCNGHWKIVQELITHGLSIHTPNKLGLTPLHLSASSGHVEMVQQLLDLGANVDVVDESGSTPLHHGAWRKRSDVVRALLTHGALLNAVNQDGNTPLHLAYKNNHVESVKENDPTVTTTDKTHKFRRPVASVNDQLEVLQLLLDAGAKRLLRNKVWSIHLASYLW
ncbi:hypothetical protein AC1031_014008, partial [Aphanomyces cochlioides]